MMRRFVRFGLLPLLALVLLWLGFWWYAEGRLEMAFNRYVSIMSAEGWTVHTGPIVRGASPLSADVTVADLRLTKGSGLTYEVPSLSLRVRPGAPETLEIGLPTSLSVTLPQGSDFTVHFGSIKARYRFDLNAVIANDPNPLRSGQFRATDLRVDSANTNFTLISIAAMGVSVRHDRRATSDHTAYSVHTRLAGFAMSPLFATIGNLPFEGKLKEFGFDLTLSGPADDLPHHFKLPASQHVTLPAQLDHRLAPALRKGEAIWQAIGPALHRWARAGGHGSFGLSLELGPLDAHDTGTIGFDGKTQPKIATHLVADGLGKTLGVIAARDPGLVRGISTLITAAAPYMHKGPKGGQRLAIDLALSGGRLTANGTQVATVPPVTWPRASAGGQ